jgi:hypothetical protein
VRGAPKAASIKRRTDVAVCLPHPCLPVQRNVSGAVAFVSIVSYNESMKLSAAVVVAVAFVILGSCDVESPDDCYQCTVLRPGFADEAYQVAVCAGSTSGAQARCPAPEGYYCTNCQAVFPCDFCAVPTRHLSP